MKTAALFVLALPILIACPGPVPPPTPALPQGDCMVLDMLTVDTVDVGSWPISVLGTRTPDYMGSKYNWFLEGPGTLTQFDGATQHYTPPASLPDNKPVTVKIYYTCLCPVTQVVQRSPDRLIKVMPVTEAMLLRPLDVDTPKIGHPGGTVYLGVSPWPIPTDFSDSRDAPHPSVSWTQENIPGVTNPVVLQRCYLSVGAATESAVKISIPAQVDRDYEVRFTATMWDPWFKREATVVQVLQVKKD